MLFCLAWSKPKRYNSFAGRRNTYTIAANFQMDTAELSKRKRQKAGKHFALQSSPLAI